LFFSFHLFGASISIDSNTTKVNIYKNSEIFIDKGNKYTISTLKKSPSLFKPTLSQYGSFGYPLEDTIWVKFVLHNTSKTAIQKLLVFSNPFTDIINLYTDDQKQINEVKSGILQKKEFDNTLQFAFPLSLQSNDTTTYYLQLMPRTGSLLFNLTVEDNKHFYIEETSRQMILYLFFGAMFALIIYNALLFTISRDSVYLYYSLYLFAITLHHLSLTGIISYLLPYGNKTAVAFEASLSVHYATFVAVTCILFTRSFLSTKQYKKIDNMLIAFILLTLSISILSTPEHYFLSLAIYNGFFLTLVLEFVGIYAYTQNNKQARYFIIAWTISLSGIFSLIAYRANIFDILSTFPYYFEATLFAEAILFSIVLANKLNHLKHEKLILTKELIDQQRNEQTRLSNLVNERTGELNEALSTHKILLHELHHRVKNNMQFITSLYALKLQDSNDLKINEKLKDIESKIKSIGHVHEMLYQQNDIDCIEAKIYFKKLIDEISKAFDISNITIKISADQTILNAYESIYCGLILNELIINAIKYAFDNGDGEISIIIKDENNSKRLEVYDSGKGLNANDFNRSFGLLMVKSLAEEQLKGSFEYDGTRFIISF
jgi:two-component sensor histidine kinase